jgi:hypothetical protein
MPHFTMPFPPGGPIVNAVVAPSQARQDALRAAGLPLPAPIRVRALIDTGASCTSIDPSVVAGLGLNPTGTAQVHTPSTGNTPHQALQYDVMIGIPGSDQSHPPAIFPTVPVITATLLGTQGFHALFGRDLLDDCVLVYNGSMKFFTLAW